MSDPTNNPSQLHGHATYVAGAAKSALGFESGEADKEYAVKEMRAAREASGMLCPPLLSPFPLFPPTFLILLGIGSGGFIGEADCWGNRKRTHEKRNGRQTGIDAWQRDGMRGEG